MHMQEEAPPRNQLGFGTYFLGLEVSFIKY